jgi:hypothetical protein
VNWQEIDTKELNKIQNHQKGPKSQVALAVVFLL